LDVYFLGLLFQSTTGSLGDRWIDRRASFRDLRNLSVHIDYEGRPIRQAVLRHQDAVQFGDFSVVIAQEGIRCIQFF
jgi:hypothetical protein